MIRGETVQVALRVDGGTDRLGNPTVAYADPVPVRNVLVAPATMDEVAATRPDGIVATYTLHFPRGYRADLRGAIVTVRGDEYRVAGDPAPYTEADVPGEWSMPVTVGRRDG